MKEAVSKAVEQKLKTLPAVFNEELEAKRREYWTKVFSIEEYRKYNLKLKAEQEAQRERYRKIMECRQYNLSLKVKQEEESKRKIQEARTFNLAFRQKEAERQRAEQEPTTISGIMQMINLSSPIR